MSELFLIVLNMSFTASYVILFVMLMRLLLKKAPKIITYILWSVVGFRLIIPFTFESMFSLMPQNTQTATISSSIIYEQNPQINSGIQVIDASINKILPVPNIGDSVNPLQIYLEIGTAVWLFGVILLVSYSILSIWKLKRQLKGAQWMGQNIYEYAYLKTPFVLGVVKPKIYLPTHLKKEERDYILLHEQTHIQRKDHLIKMIAFFVTSIHWFNPLVWVSYRLMSIDMEYACDERVLKLLDPTIKKTYATSLLALATDRHILNGSPLAFVEGNVKGRIKNVLDYKKPGLWVIVSTAILVVGVSIGLIANPINAVKLSDVVAFPVESLEHSAYGTFIFENKVIDLNKAETEEVADYLRELQVNKSPVSKSRDMNRDHTNQISLVFKGIYNEDMGNIDVNFNKDFSIVWIDNDVKPSFSYSIKQPNDVRNFFEKQVGSIESIMEIGSAEQLWKARTQYIGDNSAVGTLISLLPVPQDVSYDHFTLNTSKQPYGIEIVYSASSEVVTQYDTEENVKSNFFHKNALILLALIDNADSVRTVLTDGKREVGFISTREWAEATVGGDVRRYAESSKRLQVLLDMFHETILDTKIEPTTPKLSVQQSLGVAMPELDYASDDIVIFHSYFGLFVYDLNKLQIIRSIDLKSLNCDQIQGSNYCEASVSEDGNTVYLHPMESENMYIYVVTNNTLKEVPYEQMENRFRGVPIEGVIDSTELGMYSYNAAQFNTDEYGYLYSSDLTLSTLAYVRGDMMYQIFEGENN
nr:M56 family metallopeptidase [uncultured Niameybacter sp.]